MPRIPNNTQNLGLCAQGKTIDQAVLFGTGRRWIGDESAKP
jgi:hypothetical protein